MKIFVRAFLNLLFISVSFSAYAMESYLDEHKPSESSSLKSIQLELDQSPYLDKEEKELLIENVVRQKEYYLNQASTKIKNTKEYLIELEKLTQTKTLDFVSSLNEIKKRLSHQKLKQQSSNFLEALSNIQTYLSIIEKYNAELDAFATRYGIIWPSLPAPYQENFQKKASDLLKANGTRKLQITPSYSMDVILEDPADEKSIYALYKKSANGEEWNRELSQKLKLSSCSPGGIIPRNNFFSYQNFAERFIKLYPFKRAVLTSSLDTLAFCDTYASSSRWGALNADGLRLGYHLNIQSIKNCFWHFVIAQLSDNAPHNMMVYVNEKGEFSIFHIDFEHSGKFDNSSFDITEYPFMLKLPLSFSPLTQQDVDQVLSWPSDNQTSFIQQNIQKWMKEGKTLREVAYEVIGDDALSARKGTASYFTTRFPKTGLIDFYYYRDFIPAKYGKFVIWNNTQQELKFSVDYHTETSNNQVSVIPTEEYQLPASKGWNMSFLPYYNKKKDANSTLNLTKMVFHFKSPNGAPLFAVEDNQITDDSTSQRFLHVSSKSKPTVVSFENFIQTVEGEAPENSSLRNFKNTRQVDYHEDKEKVFITEFSSHFISAEPITFNMQSPFAEKNTQLAKDLYRKSLDVLENLKNETLIKNETLATLPKLGGVHDSWHNDCLIKAFKATRAKIAASFGDERADLEREASDLQTKLYNSYRQQELHSEKKNEKLLDGTFFPSLGGALYRDIAFVKSEAQDLYNMLELRQYQLDNGCTPKIKENKVLNQIEKVMYALDKIGPTSAQKILEGVLANSAQ